MIFKLIVASALFVAIYAKCRVCPNHPPLYNELGCTPIKHGLHCPTSFTCPDLSSLSKNKCHFNGISYTVGATLANVTGVPPCSSGCKCRRDSNNVAGFSCPYPNCLLRPIKGCIYQSTLNGCCSSKVCGAAAINPPNCYYNGQTYRKGSIIYPPNSCYKCICDENFDNSTSYLISKNCQPINCGVELHHMKDLQQGCAPIFSGSDGCCPFDYRCPTAGDFIVPSATPNTNTDPTMTCKFGSLTLQRFDSLNSTDPCRSCQCNTPPMVQCIQKPKCTSPKKSAS